MNNSLKNSLKALINALKDLFKKMPLLFFGFTLVAYWLIIEFSYTVQHKQYVLCLLILFVSIGVYVKNKSISETTLSFMIGILTVFTIDWSKSDFTLFIVIYLCFNILIFLIGSVRLASKQEVILVQAANNLSLNQNYDEIFKKLKQITDTPTKGQQLDVIEKAVCIRFLSFRRISIDNITDALNSIEIIQNVYQIDLNKACNIFYILYIFSCNLFPNINIYQGITILFNKILLIPLPPDDFFAIFTKTKKEVISKKLSFDRYINIIKELAYDGLDSQEIIDKILKM